MRRRQFLTMTGALSVAGYVGAAGADIPHVEYSKAAYETALASGNPLMLDFYAEW